MENQTECQEQITNLLFKEYCDNLTIKDHKRFIDRVMDELLISRLTVYRWKNCISQIPRRKAEKLAEIIRDFDNDANVY